MLRLGAHGVFLRCYGCAVLSMWLDSVCVAAMASARALSWLSQIAAVQCYLCAVQWCSLVRQVARSHNTSRRSCGTPRCTSRRRSRCSSAWLAFASVLQAASEGPAPTRPVDTGDASQRVQRTSTLPRNGAECKTHSSAGPKRAEHAANRLAFERQTALARAEHLQPPLQLRSARNTRPRRSKKRLEA